MPRKELEDLAWRLRELARTLANRAGEDSTTSSRPPSSDNPYRRGERGKPAAAEPASASPESAGKPIDKDAKPETKPAGKRPGAKGYWRSQPIVSGAADPPRKFSTGRRDSARDLRERQR